MSEEVAAAIGTIEYWRNRAEQAESLALTLQQQRDQAEADAAAWLAFVGEAARQLEHGAKCEEIQSDLFEAHYRATQGNAPGAALLAELEAARAIVARWRDMPRYYDDCDPGQNDPYYAWWAEMDDLVIAYDQAVKASKG